jgi:hypothetical protein
MVTPIYARARAATARCWLPMVLIVLQLSACSTCSIGDQTGAKNAQDQALLRSEGYTWLENAKTCKVGRYVVTVPASDSGNDAPILIARDGKPVLERSSGDTMLFDPNLKRARADHPIVDIWHNAETGDVTRVWYQTVPDANGKYVMLYDMNFDGQPDSRSTWQGHELVTTEVWFEEKWVPMKNGCIEVGNKCIPARFGDGRWRLDEGAQSK